MQVSSSAAAFFELLATSAWTRSVAAHFGLHDLGYLALMDCLTDGRLTFVFLGERPPLREWSGIAMVAGGVLVLAIKR